MMAEPARRAKTRGKSDAAFAYASFTTLRSASARIAASS
jgi:hypothetical protein